MAGSQNTHKIIHSAPELGHNLAPASAAPIIHSSVPQVASRAPQQPTLAHRRAQVSAHAQQWSRGRAELWTPSSSAVGWPRVRTSILIVAEAFLRRSSPLERSWGTPPDSLSSDPSQEEATSVKVLGGGEFSAACNHTSMQGERKWCSLAKDPAPPPRLLRAARDIDPCVLNPSALPFSKVHLEKRIYAAGPGGGMQNWSDLSLARQRGESGSGKDWELPGLPGAVLQSHARPP